MNPPDLISRRQFLARAGCAALGTTGLLSTLINLGLAGRVAAAENTGDYKALICLFLLGGNDSFNMVIPTAPEEYRFYSELRGGVYDEQSNPSGLAIPPDTLHAVKAERPFGLHPGFGPLQKLYHGGELAFVCNVGSLRDPIATVADYRSRRFDMPLGLFSHSDQQQQWQTCVTDARSGIGWAGRAMDILGHDQSRAGRATFNISLSGMNVLQTGYDVAPYTVNARGVRPLLGYDPKAHPNEAARLRDQVSAARSEAFESLMQGVYHNLFERTYARTTRGAIDALERVQSDLAEDLYPDWNASAASNLEAQLKMVARLIPAQRKQGIRRQTFFIGVGGYDTHADLIPKHGKLLSELGAAIGQFWAHLPETEKRSVALFTASDFARTLTGNGRGSDHAWGGNHLVLGGAVNGGHLFGQYPLFTAHTFKEIDVGQGRLIPSYAVEEYLYPILRWFGLSDRDLFEHLFPGYAARFGSGGIRKRYPLFKTA